MAAIARLEGLARPAHHLTSRSGGLGPLVALVVVVVTPLGLAVTLDRTTYDKWGLFVWAPVVMLLSLPICRWLAVRTGEPDRYRFFVGVAFLKIVIGGLLRYFVLTEVYASAGDAVRYDNAAALLAGPFRNGDFTNLGEITGTRFLEVVAGLVQALIGETYVGTFIVFSFFGFVGLALLYAAFCEALPNGNRVLFRRLLFLLPTMWFWPSSIGKEAFLILCIGAVAYGAARMSTGNLSGVLVAALGMWGTITVRPHLALALGAGLLASIPPERSHGVGPKGGRRALAFVLPLVAIAALPVIFSSMEDFFGIENLDLTSAQEVQDEVTRLTDQGGSDFTPVAADDPVGLVLSTTTVLFRPFPYEASNAQAALASLESVVLGGIVLVALRRGGLRLIVALRRRYVRFAVGYLLAFAVGFSAIANFGILVRQRSLALPFLFVWLAAAPPGHGPARDEVATAPRPRVAALSQPSG